MSQPQMSLYGETMSIRSQKQGWCCSHVTGLSEKRSELNRNPNLSLGIQKNWREGPSPVSSYFDVMSFRSSVRV